MIIMNEIVKYQIFRDLIFPIIVVAVFLIILSIISFIEVHIETKKQRRKGK